MRGVFRDASRGSILLPAMLAAGPALAAGGAHVIDDAAVETPGTCHLESWITRASKRQTLIYSAPACTRLRWPNLELGGFASHAWSRDSRDTVIGLSPKLALRSEERGIGLGVAGSLGFGVNRSHFETASLTVPVTIPVGKRLRLNANIGWQWARASHSHDAFVGGQIEYALKSNVSLMAEAFTRDHGKAGGQTGIRWTIGKGRIDVDLLAGRYVDGVTPTAITFGITMRR